MIKKPSKFVEPSYLALDFEFNCTTHEKVNLVSCVTHDSLTQETKKFWLHNSPEGKSSLRKHISRYEYILGYACVAEARSFYSLGLDPLKFKWLDLFLEYRMLSNHNDTLNWGKQLVDGKIKTVYKPKPKWERTESDGTGFKPTHSLAEATFKLTGEIRDTVEKTKCRDLIISNPAKFTSEEQQRILDQRFHRALHLNSVLHNNEYILTNNTEYKALIRNEEFTSYFKMYQNYIIKEKCSGLSVDDFINFVN